MPLQHLVMNFAPASIRNETMEGREYLVVPVAMITEGVHAGSNGPLFYSEAELSKRPVVWNQKPIVVYHPMMNGISISACDPEVITAQKVGVVMNTHWDKKAKKLRAEAWLEKERVMLVDDRVMKAIETNTMMEVSTGLFTDNDFVEGTHNGKSFQYKARNLAPDHLALLPDKVGACSIADGAGLLQANALSHNDIRQAIQTVLGLKHGYSESGMPSCCPYVTDVYDTTFVYEEDGKLFQMSYSQTDAGVDISGSPTEVVRVTEYRTVAGGSFVGNATHTLATENEKMKKKELVDGLIANTATQWSEQDRAFLMAHNEDVLGKMTPIVPAAVLPTAEEIAAEQQLAIEGAAKKAVENAATAGASNVARPAANAAEYIAQAPADIREMLQAGLAANQAEKARLVQVITANKANVFTPAMLEVKSTAELQCIAALAANVSAVKPVQSFAGASGGAPVANNAPVTESPLLPPTMN